MKLVSKIFNRNDWYVTSEFGYRNSIKTKNGMTNTFHNGCDYGTNGEKWPQYAITDGTILSCGVGTDGGKFIWVNYPTIKKKLLHYHLDSICVSKEQKVQEGTLLGYTGSTGKATGIHLHLGMQDSQGNGYQDPHQFDYNPMNSSSTEKDLEKIAYEVIKGKWGNGDERIKRIIKYGYDYEKIQNIVNKILNNNKQEEVYIVKDGDNLDKIAKIFNTTWEEIYKKNKIIIGNNPDLIKPGQILEI